MKKVCAAIPQQLIQSYLAMLIVVSGNWKGAAPVPEFSLEALEERLKGDEKEDFLRFLRRMLCWLPEERASAKELLFDPWLMRGLFK